MLLYCYVISFSIAYSLIVIKKRQFTIILFLSPRVQKLESWQRRPTNQQAAASKRKTRAKPELQIKIFTATQQYRLCDTSAQRSASPPPNTSQFQHVNIMSFRLLFRPVTGCYIGVLSSQLPIKIPTVQYCFKHSTCPNRHG